MFINSWCSFVLFLCPYKVINASAWYNDGFLPGTILLTLKWEGYIIGNALRLELNKRRRTGGGEVRSYFFVLKQFEALGAF